MKEQIGLCSLPAELQDQVVLNLHPSAAIALRQTNRYYHANVSLHKLVRKEVRRYLGRRERHPGNEKYFSCELCLALKLDTILFKKEYHQTARFDIGYNGQNCRRICLECAIKTKMTVPGNVVVMAKPRNTFEMVTPSSPLSGHKSIFCMACLTVKGEFCYFCRWCFDCVQKRFVNTYRQDDEGHGKSRILNRCWTHKWNSTSNPALIRSAPIRSVDTADLAITQELAVRHSDMTGECPFGQGGWIQSRKLVSFSIDKYE